MEAARGYEEPEFSLSRLFSEDKGHLARVQLPYVTKCSCIDPTRSEGYSQLVGKCSV